MEAGRLIPKINSYINVFTKAEKKVAQFVLDNIDKIVDMTVTEMAEEVSVGETTVLRFCRKLGFKGFQAFKMAVAKETVHSEANLYENMDENDETQTMIQKITQVNTQVLQETVSLLDPKELEKAIHLLVTQRRIVFYGVGVSGNTAADAKNKFMRIGFFVEVFTDSHLQAMSAATLCENDVAVGISVSGSTKDTVDALKIAKENGAKIISITHFTRSPITKISDVILLTGGRETPLEGGSMAAKIAQLHVIDLLFTGVARQMKGRALHYKEKTAKAVVNKAY